MELSRESCSLTGGNILKLMGGLSLKYQNFGSSIMEALHWKQYSWKSICGFMELSRESCKLTVGSILKLMGGLSLKYQYSGSSILEAEFWKHYTARSNILGRVFADLWNSHARVAS